MADTREEAENEIKSWLSAALKKENLKDLSVSIVGNTEKGDGYNGDLVFVTVHGVKEDNTTKEYNLVVKCGKRSEALRERGTTVQMGSLNEIAIYDKILPYYIQFQKEKGIQSPFDTFAKCYGTFIGENVEVVVLENLKCRGYELWPMKQALTRKHVDMIVKDYAKFHATSVALQIQRPKVFQSFVDSITDVPSQYAKSAKPSDIRTLFGTPIDQSYELLKNDLDEHTLSKWKNLKQQTYHIYTDMIWSHAGLRVILHGDGWSNNFMHLHEKQGIQKIPLKIAFLDWQMTRFCSPILDLSYFLFSCSSEEDMEEIQDMLTLYYKSFINQLKGLGTKEPETIYSYDQFLEDWGRYSKYGIMFSCLLMKIASTEKDEVLDIGKAAESGRNVIESFTMEIRNKENFKASRSNPRRTFPRR